MIKNIIFDFDGVILDSVPIKTEAFRFLFRDFNKTIVDEFIAYHLVNGGISRYKKIKYFFEKILNEQINQLKVLEYAEIYSRLTKKELSKPKYLIKDTINFIQNNYQNYNLHVASGADENDLRYICDTLDLNQYFISIYGSPKVKDEIVKDILIDNNYTYRETILIGDSINDYNAATKNSITFYGFNNIKLKKYNNYISSFETLHFD